MPPCCTFSPQVSTNECRGEKDKECSYWDIWGEEVWVMEARGGRRVLGVGWGRNMVWRVTSWRTQTFLPFLALQEIVKGRGVFGKMEELGSSVGGDWLRVFRRIWNRFTVRGWGGAILLKLVLWASWRL